MCFCKITIRKGFFICLLFVLSYIKIKVYEHQTWLYAVI